MSELMQAADVFERWKVVGKSIVVNFEVEDGVEITPEYLTRCIEFILEAGESSGHIVSVVSHVGNGTEPYINPSVKVVSDGRSWKTLHDTLISYGIPHTTNDELFCFPQSIGG